MKQQQHLRSSLPLIPGDILTFVLREQKCRVTHASEVPTEALLTKGKAELADETAASAASCASRIAGELKKCVQGGGVRHCA